jgi:hypothetical protein
MSTDKYLSVVDRIVRQLTPINHIVDMMAKWVIPNIKAQANPYPLCTHCTGGIFMQCMVTGCCWPPDNGHYQHPRSHSGLWTYLWQSDTGNCFCCPYSPETCTSWCGSDYCC